MGTSQEGLWSMTKGEFEDSVRRFEEAIKGRGGNPRAIFDKFRTDGDFVRQLAEFACRGGVAEAVNHLVVRAIMGQNFFGPADWTALYGVNFSKKELRAVAQLPWGEEVLNAPCPFYPGKQVKETHFAFLGLTKFKGQPLTIRKWQEIHPATGQPRFYGYAPECWYAKEDFATKVTARFEWRLILKDIVPDSEGKDWESQKKMLPSEYEPMSAVINVTKDILCVRKTGIWPNPERYSRCEDIASDGNRVLVGSGAADGLLLGGWDVDDPHGSFGLGASRRFPSVKIIKGF